MDHRAVPQPDEWTASALCGQYEDTEVWTLEPTSSDKDGMRSSRLLAALELCNRCPTRRPCLEEAVRGLTSPVDGVQMQVVGIWGGSTTRDRTAARKQAPGDLAAQVAILERELPRRLAQRRKAVKAWKASGGGHLDDSDVALIAAVGKAHPDWTGRQIADEVASRGLRTTAGTILIILDREGVRPRGRRDGVLATSAPQPTTPRS